MATEDREIEALLDKAMTDTEKEVFGDAFGKEDLTHDESGDKSLEALGEGLEGQHEPEDEDEPEEGEAEAKGEEKKDKGKTDAKKDGDEDGKKPAEEPPHRDGRVPAGRLREQTERARAAEAERETLKQQIEAEKAASKKEIEALNARFDLLMQQLKQPQQQPTAPQPQAETQIPDIFEDPKGFADHMQNRFQAELRQRDQVLENLRVENSLQVAHARHGETFDAAFEAVKKLDPQNPDNREAVRKLYSAPNPGEALVQWHKRNEVLRQVGDDPTKYREQITTQARESLMKDPEFRRQLLDELRGEAETGNNGQPRTITNLPRSLSRTSGSGRADYDRSGMDGSDGAIFDTAFRT